MKPFKYLKHLYQRIKYGVSERDTWCLDYYLSDVIINGIKHMWHGIYGTPFGEDDDCGMIEQIYMDIIYTFEIEKEYANGDIYLPSRLRDETYDEYIKEMDKLEMSEFIISREHYEYYLHGWEVFKRFFGCLWT